MTHLIFTLVSTLLFIFISGLIIYANINLFKQRKNLTKEERKEFDNELDYEMQFW